MSVFSTLNVVKFWVNTYGNDFAEDSEVGRSAMEFLEMCVSTSEILRKVGELIMLDLEKKITEGVSSPLTVMIGDNHNPNEPQPSVLEFDPIRLAEKLTMIDFALFQNIKGRECLSGVWEGSVGEEKSPFINH